MIFQIIEENGVKKIQALTADTGAGAPVGSFVYMYKKSSPSGYLYCDGSTFDQTKYPALYQYLGSNVLPDYRECVAVGAEQNTTDTIASHDVYTEGQFKDDQLQNIKINPRTNGYDVGVWSDGSLPESNSPFTEGTPTGQYGTGGGSGTFKTLGFDASKNVRAGTTTHGKQKAVFIYIKATSGLTENQQENVLNTINENLSYSTTEHKTGKKWIDGKDIYSITLQGAFSTASMDISHNIIGIEQITKIEGFLTVDGQILPNGMYLPASGAFVSMWATRQTIFIRSIQDYTSTMYEVTLEYTKTTDN